MRYTTKSQGNFFSKAKGILFGASLAALASFGAGCDLGPKSSILAPEQPETSNPCIEYMKRLKPALAAELRVEGPGYYPFRTTDYSNVAKVTSGSEFPAEFDLYLTDIMRKAPVSGFQVRFKDSIYTTNEQGFVHIGKPTGILECRQYAKRALEEQGLQEAVVYMIPQTRIQSSVYNNDLWRFMSQIFTEHQGVDSVADNKPLKTIYPDNDSSQKVKIFISSNNGKWSEADRLAFFEGVYGSFEQGEQVTHPLDLPVDAYVDKGLEDAAFGRDIYDLWPDSASADRRIISSAPYGGGDFSNLTFKLIALNGITGTRAKGIGRHEEEHHLFRVTIYGHSKDRIHLFANGGGDSEGEWSRDELLAILSRQYPINLTNCSQN